jgi:glutamate-5-semialdehyde dehydrogenase
MNAQTDAQVTADSDIPAIMQEIGVSARTAARVLAMASTDAKNNALKSAAAAIRAGVTDILSANKTDIEAADERGISNAMRDRLLLNEDRIESMAVGLETIAELGDPIGDIIADWTPPNGLRITRVRVPLGVIGIIYESRPNVTADAGALCLKSGNAVILRGGSESFHSSRAIFDCLQHGLKLAGLPAAAIQIVPTTDRAAVGELLRMHEHVDIIVPRGGRGLIARVQNESRVPVIAHLDGLCHVYVHAGADFDMARDITVNAKMRRTGICGAAETLLVDRAVAKSHLPAIIDALVELKCEIRGDEAVTASDSRVKPATPEDWDTEYLDSILSVRIVDGIDEAIEHIENHGSNHTDTIVTGDAAAAAKFLNEVDSAIVLHNASTQYADGGEFGMGAEIGISTDKFHARGPVGVEQLTSYKYVVHGSGQVRP